MLRAAAAALRGWRAAGFYTEEIRVGGERQGFRAVTFDGQECAIAHVRFRGPHRVGKYGVDVAVIDALAARTLTVDTAIDVYLVDEIGKMECLSARFVAAMRALLRSGRPVVATIAQRGGGFISEVKARPNGELWLVTRVTRDAMPGRVLAWLGERAPGGG